MKQASEAYRDGDGETGKLLLTETRHRLRAAMDSARTGSADDMQRELEDVDDLEAMIDEVGSAYMSKASLASYDAMTRKRGRRRAETDRNQSDT